MIEECKNISESSDGSFEYDPEELKKAMEMSHVAGNSSWEGKMEHQDKEFSKLQSTKNEKDHVGDDIKNPQASESKFVEIEVSTQASDTTGEKHLNPDGQQTTAPKIEMVSTHTKSESSGGSQNFRLKNMSPDIKEIKEDCTLNQKSEGTLTDNDPAVMQKDNNISLRIKNLSQNLNSMGRTLNAKEFHKAVTWLRAIVENLQKFPGNQKYREIFLDNKTFKQRLLPFQDCMQFLHNLGFQNDGKKLEMRDENEFVTAAALKTLATIKPEQQPIQKPIRSDQKLESEDMQAQSSLPRSFVGVDVESKQKKSSKVEPASVDSAEAPAIEMAEISRLNNQIMELERNLEDSDKELKILKDKHDRKQAEYSEELKSWKDRLAAAEQKKARIKKESAEENKKREKLESLIAQKDREIKELQGRLGMSTRDENKQKLIINETNVDRYKSRQVDRTFSKQPIESSEREDSDSSLVYNNSSYDALIESGVKGISFVYT